MKFDLKWHLDDISKWFKESSDFGICSLEEMLEEGYDYEIYLTLHLVTGTKIELLNRYEESYKCQTNCGDSFIVGSDEDEILEIELFPYKDKPTITIYLPYSQISYIEYYTKCVDTDGWGEEETLF